MRNVIGKFVAVVALCVTGTFSAEKGEVPSIDLLKASADSIATADSIASSGTIATADSVAADSLPAVKADSSLKTVLYLGGGERSPWFQLGVFYAIEEYGIPVDSVVATS